MRKLLVFVTMLLISLGLFATEYHSVDLNSEAYRIIEIGEIRGIIPVKYSQVST